MTEVPASILVVDDDTISRALLVHGLELDGHRVAVADDGRQALELLRAGRYDIVLLDVLMPELDGYDTLAQIVADEALRHIPVIMVSALEEVESVARCLEMGAQDYLPKPFNPVLLRARINGCLTRKRLDDTIRAQAEELADWNRTLNARVEEQVAEIERVSRLRGFLSPQVADAIVAAGDESVLESHRREITAVFCDLRGFTRFSETADPEDAMRVLREYHTEMGKIIFAYGATVEHFEGDGMMLYLNDPIPVPDATLEAVRMALAMRDRAAELAEGWRRQGYELGLGVGVALGHATLGRIGFEGRFGYGAVGSVVNMAARLGNAAAGGQVLITQRVFAAVEQFVETEPVGELELKGFHGPQRIYSLIALNEQLAAARAAVD
jgi:class 3 adenylate cyclase/CheY-like chemotaxis protein